MNDARQLGTIERAPGIQTDQDRGRRFLLLAEKSILIWQSQMHPGTLHGRQGLNRAGQLTFQSALKREALLKLRHAKPVRIHRLKTSDRPLGQALRGQAQASVVNLVRRHQNRTTAIGMLIWNVHGCQLGHDGATVFVRQVGIQHAPLGLAPHHQPDDANGDEQSQPQADTKPLGLVQPGKSLGQGRVDGNSGSGGHHGFQKGVVRICTTNAGDYSGSFRKH